MFEYLIYVKELKRLSKERHKLSEKFAELEKSYKGEDDHGHLSFLGHEQYELDCWIEYYKTTYLKSKADKLLVPMPDAKDAEMYRSCNFDDEQGDLNILTTKGMHKLRVMLREESKARREVVAFWFTIITGLIGATIGLVSVLKA
ncbi:hypothetical protein GCM10009347_41810 [Shewanella algicola]|jgi:hypothetical protein|uniref:Uncharacterized protein n=1 Tax=Shewanella algicola TaxID=640633 RepID=A0A9X1ZIU2_9GAMM|nr:hypothetical protein [Shewanella algicola]MCL1107773.1 hypothetical protein [Shewanella algicola]GGP72813.1 hypothetical protein GCM10009347_41810 [Shewanella algicola]